MVVIDPGHGGSDPGALGNNLQEKDYNLLISKYMYDRFRELGIPVAITRNEDVTLAPTERTDIILDAFGNNPNVVVISNHLNAGGGTGAEVIYALRNTDVLAKNILENIGEAGQTTRKYYQRRLPSNTSKDYYFIHRNTGVTEPVIVEYGFIDDTASNVKFLQDNYKELAEAVIEAVANYKGYNYISPSGVSTNTYIVKSGDSLYSIARKFNTTVDELKRLNNLSSNLLNIGQVLRLPTGKPTQVVPSDTDTYIVKSGDSLYKIANAYNTTVDELKSLNNLSSNILSIGQVLKVPKSASSEITSTIDYVVKSGDNLYAIARKYNTTVNEIKSLNNLGSDILSVGQILKIPTVTPSQEQKETYIVQSGDSLYSIARKFNTTVDELKRLNNLSSNLLSIGQVLVLPIESTGQTTYTVQAGDSLYSIARKFNTTVDNIKALNNLSSNLLNIGQILIVK
ncbi:MAG: LysM peptidoglycan-binding domain-containing protein [Bacilli bacterium]